MQPLTSHRLHAPSGLVALAARCTSAAWLGLLPAVLGACQGTVDVSPGVAADSFAVVYADAYCGPTRDCCASHRWAPNPKCHAAIEAELRDMMATARGAGATYDDAAAAACVEAVRANAASCPSWKSGRDAWPPPCDAVYTAAQGAVGDACVTSWQCADDPPSHGRCLVNANGGSAEGRCVLVSHSNEGEPCGVSDDDFIRSCHAPLICFPDGICRSRLPPGAHCVTDPVGGELGDLCSEHYVCDRLVSKSCVPARQAGAACTAAEQCELYECREGTCLWPGRGAFPLACLD